MKAIVKMNIDISNEGKTFTGTIENLMFYSFACAIIAMPFNGLDKLPYLFGEMSTEGSFYFLGLVIILGVIEAVISHKLVLPRSTGWFIFLAFTCWTVIASAANFYNISESLFKGRTGLDKCLLQIGMLWLLSFSVAFCYRVLRSRSRETVLKTVHNAMVAGLVICGVYSLFEIAWFNNNVFFAETFVKGFDSLFRTHTQVFYGRLRSVCAEPSWFGNFYAVSYPFLIMLLFKQKSWKFALCLVLTMYTWLMVYLSLSRIAYAVTIIETVIAIILLWLGYKGSKHRKYVILFLIAAVIFSISAQNLKFSKRSSYLFDSIAKMPTVHIQEKGYPYASSNKSRLGGWVTGYRIGVENPVFGVGYGQYGFYMPDFAPEWSLKTKEAQEYVNDAIGTSWPSSHNVYSTIFAETGALGLLLWLILWGYFGAIFIKQFLNSIGSPDMVIYNTGLILATIGVLLCGLSFGSIRLMNYWILMPVFMYISEKNSNVMEHVNGKYRQRMAKIRS